MTAHSYHTLCRATQRHMLTSSCAPASGARQGCQHLSTSQGHCDSFTLLALGLPLSSGHHPGLAPTLGDIERVAQREVDGEPAGHVRCVRVRVRAEPHVAVELRVKVAPQAMAHCARAEGRAVTLRHFYKN